MQESQALATLTQLHFPSPLSANYFVSSEKDDGAPPETALKNHSAVQRDSAPKCKVFQ